MYTTTTTTRSPNNHNHNNNDDNNNNDVIVSRHRHAGGPIVATAAARTATTANVTGTTAAAVAVTKRGTSSYNNNNRHNDNDNNDFQKNYYRYYYYHIGSALFAGVGSGTVASIACAPIDLIKTRMQVWGETIVSSAAKTTTTPPPGVVSIFRDILQRDGWKGCFRGLGASLVTVPFFWGVYFPLYDESKRRWSHRCPETSPLWIHCGSAVFAGAVSDLVCNPLFVVRTRLQTEALHNSSSNSGMIQTTKSLYNESGGNLAVFWRGMTANMIGLSHAAVQFPVYEQLKHWLLHRRIRRRHNHHDDDYDTNTHMNHLLPNNYPQQSSSSQSQQEKHNTVGELLLASGLSKATAMVLTYPHEVVRSRMMDVRGKTGQGLIKVCARIYRNEGMRGFYSGMPISLVRVVPNSCITFMTYELLLRYARETLFSFKTFT